MSAITVVATEFTSSVSLIFVVGNFEFCLDRQKARLHESVVVILVRATHALPYPGATQRREIYLARVLPTTNAVMKKSWRGLSTMDRLPQNREHQRLGHV